MLLSSQCYVVIWRIMMKIKNLLALKDRQFYFFINFALSEGWNVKLSSKGNVQLRRKGYASIYNAGYLLKRQQYLSKK